MQPDLRMAKPAGPGQLVDLNKDRRIAVFIEGLIQRIEGLEGKIDLQNIRLKGFETRLAVLEGNRTVSYIVKRRQAGKFGVNDAAGMTVEEQPLTKAAAEWLAQNLNDEGPGIAQETWRTLMHLAARKSEDAA